VAAGSGPVTAGAIGRRSACGAAGAAGLAPAVVLRARPWSSLFP